MEFVKIIESAFSLFLVLINRGRMSRPRSSSMAQSYHVVVFVQIAAVLCTLFSRLVICGGRIIRGL